MDISFTKAQQLLQAALSIAEQRDVCVSIAVTDAHGELLSFARMDGAPLHTGVLAPAKAYTAARFRQPSAILGQRARESGKDMGYWVDDRMTGMGGGLPITQNNQVIGGIGVSALTEEEDAELAAAALKQVGL